MATIRVYCPCKVDEIGTAVIDWYKVINANHDALMERRATCRHCGKPLKYVGEGDGMSEAQADRVDAKIKPLQPGIPGGEA